MNIRHRENELRLDILEAVARSQRALASMAEKVAGSYEIGCHGQEDTAHQLQVLARYQLSLAEKILELRILHTRSGIPVAPWLNTDMRLCGGERNLDHGRQE